MFFLSHLTSQLCEYIFRYLSCQLIHTALGVLIKPNGTCEQKKSVVTPRNTFVCTIRLKRNIRRDVMDQIGIEEVHMICNSTTR